MIDVFIGTGIIYDIIGKRSFLIINLNFFLEKKKIKFMVKSNKNDREILHNSKKYCKRCQDANIDCKKSRI